MRILYVTSKPVYPVTDGGCLAMESFLHGLLSTGNEIRHISVSTAKHPFEQENYPKTITQSIKPLGFFLDTQVRVLPALLDLIRGRSYNLSRFQNKGLNTFILNTIQDHAVDLVILDGLYAAAGLSEIRSEFKGRVMIRTHNAEHVIWKKLGKSEKNVYRKGYLLHLAKTLKKEEAKILNLCDHIFAISPEDVIEFREMGVSAPISYLPVSIQPELLTDKIKHRSFFFIGSMQWGPNREALQQLLKVVYPEIKKRIPDAELHIAGKDIPLNVESIPDNGITVHGFVPDSKQFMKDSGILLLPVLSGSGVRIKLLEALSCGVPVISTPQGAEGIECEEAVLLSTDLIDMAIKAAELCQNPEDVHEMRLKAIDFIRKNYSPDKIGYDLKKLINGE